MWVLPTEEDGDPLATVTFSDDQARRLAPRISVAGYVLVLALGAPILASQSKTLSRYIPQRVLTTRTPGAPSG